MICFIFILSVAHFGVAVLHKTESVCGPCLKGKFQEQFITFELSNTKNVTLVLNGSASEEVKLNFNFTEKCVLKNIEGITLKEGYNDSISLLLEAKAVGHTVLYVNATPANMTDFSKAYVHISVSHTDSLNYVSEVVGWLYFTAWSISFYPQIILNFKRKSVIGLHFDFLALNVVGFCYYGLFNIGLYWIPSIEAEYFSRHEFGVNPVQLNDVIFALHAFIACLMLVVQCMLYENGDQQVSRTARSIIVIIIVSTFVAAVLSATLVVFGWLDFLYFISYVKLFITLIKYIPQVYYNYQRQSTVGWSIGNVLLDFTGGMLSIAQMFIIAYNYNDWGSIFGDPTKFGLGLFSMLFDIVFMVQHYALYGPRKGQLQPLLRSPVHSLREAAIAESGSSNYGAIVG